MKLLHWSKTTMVGLVVAGIAMTFCGMASAQGQNPAQSKALLLDRQY
jgi:hypothetical protein